MMGVLAGFGYVLLGTTVLGNILADGILKWLAMLVLIGYAFSSFPLWYALACSGFFLALSLGKPVRQMDAIDSAIFRYSYGFIFDLLGMILMISGAIMLLVKLF